MTDFFIANLPSLHPFDFVRNLFISCSHAANPPPDILAPLIAGWVLFGVAVAVVVVVAASAIGFLVWKKAPVKV